MSGEQSPIDPNRLTAEQAAKLLSAAFKSDIPLAHLRQDLAAGAPTNADGTINLVHYAAWLAREMGRNQGEDANGQ